MYLSRSMLILMAVIYLLFLLSADWLTAAGAWYRPHLVALAAIATVALTRGERDGDEF